MYRWCFCCPHALASSSFNRRSMFLSYAFPTHTTLLAYTKRVHLLERGRYADAKTVYREVERTAECRSQLSFSVSRVSCAFFFCILRSASN